MRNKELLMVGITEREPHIILTTDSFYDASISAFGYGYSHYAGAGLVSRIPCWGGYGMMQNYTALSLLAMVDSDDPAWDTIISWRNPFKSSRLVVTRLDTGKSVEFVNMSSSTSSLVTDGTLFKSADQGRAIPLIFDPPPPDYYLIPLRANQSRVLCRRRGSKC